MNIFTTPNKNEQNSETRTSEFLLVSNIVLQTLRIKQGERGTHTFAVLAVAIHIRYFHLT